MMFSKCLSLFIFATLLLTTSAHAPRRPGSPYSINRLKRSAAPPSTCAFMQCAVSHGNCGADSSSLAFCPLGEHCDGTSCIDNIPLGSTCNPTAFENECSEGRCMDSGNGPICQKFQEVLPGGSCTQDSQCYFSESADGSGSISGTCVSGVCSGRNIGDACLASHQCVIGSFCSSTTSTCQALGASGDSCSDDSHCNGKFTCLSGKCSNFYTQSKGQICSSTDNCAPGLYCKNGECATASALDRTATPCDIKGNDCGADMQCNCANYTTQGQTATCSPIQGTFSKMPTIQKSAFSCLDQNSCGNDVTNADTVACIEKNCMSEFCTYFTRITPELFEEFPSCVVSRIAGNSDYSRLINSCTPFRAIRGVEPSTGAASSVSLSFALGALLITAILLF